MRKDDVQAIVRDLNAAGARYLIAGGLAVVAYGYLRLTVDIDLAVSLDHDNLTKVIAVFQRHGYRPRLPVPFEDFADEAKRRAWIAEKHLMVFSIVPEDPKGTSVDLFVRLPFDFNQEYRRVEWLDLSPDLKAPFVSLERLVSMKREAGRPRDLIDLQQLEQIERMRNERETE